MYDAKQFLPSVADVREFLIMRGERPPDMKDRKDAFRVLLRTLRALSMTDLRGLASSALHKGPSEAGPISDAIAAAGERLHRQKVGDAD